MRGEGVRMVTLPAVSVVVPTYNRKVLLIDTLNSLAQQTYAMERLEVVVVDDGSTDATETITEMAFPFTLRYFWQRNQGDAAARNYGARQSQADFLVFLDDDILLDPDYLTNLIQAHGAQPNRIVVGTWDLWQAETSAFSQSVNASLPTGAYHALEAKAAEPSADQPLTTAYLPFRDAYSNNMSLRREAYFMLGMMQGLEFSGSSMWCDLDFAYRAHRKGFDFLRSTTAICWHRDHATRSLETYKWRVHTAACRAVVLFEKYPELLRFIPMFYDKTPIHWGQDPPRLMARKLGRWLASSRLAVWSMEHIARVLEQRYPTSSLLPTLYRYIIGAHIFQGYRAGLSDKAHNWAAGKARIS
jgi:glycosyltransferase involved in cell wall biosynthesis